MTDNHTHAPPGQGRGDRFVFYGEVLALDFVNTEMRIRNKPVDRLVTASDYRDWWQAARDRYPDDAAHLATLEANPDLVPVARELRGALRRAFDRTVKGEPAAPDDLAVLNRALATARDSVALDPAGAYRAVRVPAGPTADGPLLAVAHSAFALLTGADLERLHRCANERCVLFFQDTTRSGTRRWCSTACMNRARSVANYRARKGGIATPP